MSDAIDQMLAPVGVSQADVEAVHAQAKAIQGQIQTRETRGDLARLFVTFAAASAAGPVGWAALVAGSVMAMFERGVSVDGAMIYWPQAGVPDQWDCRTNADYADERIGSPGDGFACRVLYLPDLPKSAPKAGRVAHLTAGEMAFEVRQAVVKGRPGMPSERRRAAYFARRLITGLGDTGPNGQVIRPGVPQTARTIWAAAQAQVDGINPKRVLAYLHQMLTRVHEWAPRLGVVLVDPAWTRGFDPFLGSGGTRAALPAVSSTTPQPHKGTRGTAKYGSALKTSSTSSTSTSPDTAMPVVVGVALASLLVVALIYRGSK